MVAAAILFLMDPSQKLIRSSEMPREPSYQIRLQSNQRLLCLQAFWVAILENSRLRLSAKRKYI